MIKEQSRIPNGWIETNLGQLSEIIMGQAPSGNDCNKEGRGIPFVKAGEFSTERPIIREWTTNPLKFAKSTDVLICVVGATCGKLNLGVECSIGRSVAAIRPNRALLQKFLYNFLTTRVLHLRGDSTGSSQGVISKDGLEGIKILLPPFAEQKRIVSKIEELFSELDSGIQSLKTAREQLKVYRQAVLKHAFEGKLTAIWREKNKSKLESADQLLARIEKAREIDYKKKLENWKKGLADKPKKIHTTSAFSLEELNELSELPKSWQWVRWEDILDFDTGAFKRGPFGSALKKEFFVKHSRYKVYEQYCPINDDCSFERYYITEEKFKELEGFVVKAHDFLIS